MAGQILTLKRGCQQGEVRLDRRAAHTAAMGSARVLAGASHPCRSPEGLHGRQTAGAV